jgi:hypothetical protein
LSTTTVRTRKEAEELLVRKAGQDAAFRRQLVTNPSEAIAKEFGVRIPPEVKVSVLEESDHQVFLVLPSKPSGRELADADLVAVSGGAANDKTTDHKSISNLFGSAARDSEKAADANHSAQ